MDKVIEEILRTGSRLGWPGFLSKGLLVGPAQGTPYFDLWVALAESGVPQFTALEEARQHLQS